VYTATHVGLDKRVVVKVLHPEHARSSVARARFFREGRAAAAIRHPHVVDVTDVGEHEGVGYLVMEHLDGETLGALLDRQGALPFDRAVDLLLPIIAALDAAHAAGVVHRDLKPENLFVARTATGEALPKVLDFGISRVVHDTGRRTGTAALLGTPTYMAPEQIESTRDADARSDQYALGVILYECLTGRPAFRGDNVYTILKRVGDGAFERPSAHRADLPADLEASVLRAMARDPAARFPTLHELARALLPFASARSRMTWGVVFDPGGAHGPADAPFDAASRPPPRPGAAGDTLADAAQAHDAATVPSDRGRRPRLLALAGALTLGLLIAAAVALRPRAPEAPREVRSAHAPVPAAPDAAAPVAPARVTPDAPPPAVAAAPPPVRRVEAPHRPHPRPAHPRADRRNAATIPDLPP